MEGPLHVGLGAINIGTIEIGDGQGRIVASLESHRYSGRINEMLPTAKEIVRRVNLYNELFHAVNVAQGFLRGLGRSDNAVYDVLTKALEKAKVKP